MEILEEYAFPGNVRELKNITERAAYNASSSEITAEDIGLLSREQAIVTGNTFYEKVDAFKERLIKDALTATGGNQAQAARTVGLSYHQYRYFLRKYA